MRKILILTLLGMSLGCSQENKTAAKTQQASAPQAVRDTFWIDVRTPAEFAEGHLAEAANIPLQVFPEQFSTQVPQKDKVIALYCRSGNRSGQALRIALELGYTKAFNAGAFNTLKETRK